VKTDLLFAFKQNLVLIHKMYVKSLLKKSYNFYLCKKSNMEVKGTIYKVLEIQSGSSNGREWKKSSFVIEVPGNFPKKICFDVWGDNMENFGLKEGEEVLVSFDAESREYNGKWYTNLKAWKVDKASGSAPSKSADNSIPNFADDATPMPSPSDAPQVKSSTNEISIDDDDLPF